MRPVCTVAVDGLPSESSSSSYPGLISVSEMSLLHALGPVQTWLGQELEKCGIDAMIYTRYVLSLLLHDSYDYDLQEQVLPPCALGQLPVVSACLTFSSWSAFMLQDRLVSVPTTHSCPVRGLGEWSQLSPAACSGGRPPPCGPHPGSALVVGRADLGTCLGGALLSAG